MKRSLMAIVVFLGIMAVAASDQQTVCGQIISPSNNSILTAGNDQVISWRPMKDSLSTVVLQYSTDGGFSWNYIASTGIAARSYDWIIPVDLGSYFCMIRMIGYNGTAYVTLATTGNFSVLTLDQRTSSSAVFSHRALALGNGGKANTFHHRRFPR